MESMFVLMALLALLIIGGSICGIFAMFRVVNLRRDVSNMRAELEGLRASLAKPAAQRPPEPAYAPPPRPAPIAQEPPAPPPFKPLPEPEEPVRQPLKPISPVPPLAERQPSEFNLSSLERFLGLRTIAYVGAIMLLVGMALGLKYVYDVWLDPVGRLAIGVMLSTVALGCGEYFRRRDWKILFQAMTGAAIAGYYISVFFSFQVYHLSTSGVSMGFAVVVTLLAIMLAVAHNTVSIALLAALGGFLSPILLSTGENHPYALFIYIALLDMIALGAAYFRKWRVLDVFCFLGTILIYMGWYDKFYDETQLAPALIFASLFYIVFLLVPLMNSLVRRTELGYEALALVTANAAFSLGAFYYTLFVPHRQLLGFIVVGQALLLFLLFRLWNFRMGKSSLTAQNLLLISLALALIAVPIQLKFYGLALVWAMEGVLLTWIGVRYERLLVRIAGFAALALAVSQLFQRLPLHTALFRPVMNVPFGSWLFVLVAVAIAAYIYTKLAKEAFEQERLLYIPMSLAAIGLLCALLTWETIDFWELYHRYALDQEAFRFYKVHEMTSLAVLWAAIGTVVVLIVRRLDEKWFPLVWGVLAVGTLIFLVGLVPQQRYEAVPVFNYVFLPRALFVAAVYFAAWIFRKWRPEIAAQAMEIAGHVLVIALGTMEIFRWSGTSELVTQRFGVSLASAYWGLAACALVWFGLATRHQPRRIVGVLLFGITILKVILVDTATLERIYQVLSWLACGLLLLIAAVVYHYYASMLLGEQQKEKS